MFRFDKINSAIWNFQKYITIESTPIETFVYKECGYKKDNTLPVIDDSFKPYGKTSRWGGKKDSHWWFYTKLEVLEDDMEFYIDTGKEGYTWGAADPQILMYVNGKIAIAFDHNHRTYRFEKKGNYEIYLYAYEGQHDIFIEFMPSLRKVNRLAQQFYYDVKVPLEICEYLKEDDYDRMRILDALNKGMLKVDEKNPQSEEFNESLKEAVATLKEELYDKYGDKTNVTTVCIGHTHIDIAWLWPMRQTREKAVRSFSIVVELMKHYPDYKFMSSQAILFKFVKEDAPELYEEIKKMVKAGRFEIEGAMWVEADCNLTSGESLVRQVLYGKRFFKKEFDKDCKVLWLPDVFGYSAALPQILQKSGVDTFVTSKISWNETNRMPNDTFMWEGIDGTEIFTYFLTAQDKKLGRDPVNYSTYTGNITPAQIAGTWERYTNKLLSDEALLTFGYGDGGGGPTEKMLEYQKRLEKGLPSCPKAKIDTATNFLNRLKEKAIGNKNLPKWVGELYLEYHRGTYTSMAKNKLFNRKGEYLLRNIEWLSLMSDCGYKQQEINDDWEILLTNQFHDIIPGSSIKDVYEESDESYGRMFESCNSLFDENIDSVKNNIDTDGGVVVFNSNSFENSDTVLLGDKYVYVENIPPMGYKVVKPVEKNNVTVGEKIIENSKIKVVFNDKMHIVSVFDKENNRETIKGEGNVLVAYEDIPRAYENWEISDYYKEKPWTIDNIESVETLDLGAKKGIKIERKFNSSKIVQKILLGENSRRIDFETYIDWKEKQILLKAHFPANIYANKATYDIQYGTVERPNHYNTSWDKAKFEVCAHKFADMSQPDYGVSLMSDCKYGYGILGNDMGITLLKSGIFPNPDADKCEHNFTYSFYVHEGDHRTGESSKEGYKLNNPLMAYEIEKQSGSLKDEYSFVKTNRNNIFVESVKKAEDDDGIIVRFYDAFGINSSPEFTFGFDVKKAYIADMSENTISEIEVENNGISLDVAPFEIVTLKIVR